MHKLLIILETNEKSQNAVKFHSILNTLQEKFILLDFCFYMKHLVKTFKTTCVPGIEIRMSKGGDFVLYCTCTPFFVNCYKTRVKGTFCLILVTCCAYVSLK